MKSERKRRVYYDPCQEKVYEKKGVAYCEHYPEGLPVCGKCREESTLAHDKACALLAEARAEIERLKSESMRVTPGQMVFDNLQKELSRKDKLIEQMREALRFVYRFKVGLSFNKTPAGIEASRVICAALEAAKRGE